MQNSINDEHIEYWDDGTYQTGPAHPPKGQSAAITALLMALIFLCGLASSFGVMNVHLLLRLAEQSSSELSLSVTSSQNVEPEQDFFRNGQRQIAVHQPEQECLQLRLGIQVQDMDSLSCQYWGVDGLQVLYVTDPASPLQAGDILTHISLHELTSTEQLCQFVEQLCSGQTVQMQILRSGQKMSITVTVA